MLTAFVHTLQVWIWRAQPLPQFVLLISVDAALILILRAALLHSKSFTRRSANVLVAILAVFVLPALVLAWSAGILAPSPHSVVFNQPVWASEPWMRARMAENVIDAHVLEGLTQSQVYKILGDPDGSYDFADDCWMLYRSRDVFIPMPPELAIRYDRDGHVSEVFIAPGMVDVFSEGS